MSATRRELLAALREGVDVNTEEVGYQVLYEDWLGRDHWRLDRESLPLLVGVDPERWRAHLAAHACAGEAERLLATLASDLAVDPAGNVAPARLGGWARQHGCSLPQPFERVLDFILRVVPGSAGTMDATALDGAAAEARAAEREQLLGAALMLVTRFPQQCRDEHGFFDGGRIADLILEKAALWFPLEAPALARDDIAALIERYLS